MMIREMSESMQVCHCASVEHLRRWKLNIPCLSKTLGESALCTLAFMICCAVFVYGIFWPSSLCIGFVVNAGTECRLWKRSGFKIWHHDADREFSCDTGRNFHSLCHIWSSYGCCKAVFHISNLSWLKHARTKAERRAEISSDVNPTFGPKMRLWAVTIMIWFSELGSCSSTSSI